MDWYFPVHICWLNSFIANRVETGTGQLGYVLSGSSKSDLVYKISGSDPDSNLDHVHEYADGLVWYLNLLLWSDRDQSNELSIVDDDD